MMVTPPNAQRFRYGRSGSGTLLRKACEARLADHGSAHRVSALERLGQRATPLSSLVLRVDDSTAGGTGSQREITIARLPDGAPVNARETGLQLHIQPLAANAREAIVGISGDDSVWLQGASWSDLPPVIADVTCDVLRGEWITDRPAPNEPPADAGSPAVSPRVVHGRELRRVAMELLWQAQDEVHFRELYERIRAAGFAARGRDPATTLQSTMWRAPGIRRGVKRAHYILDPDSIDRTRPLLDAATAERTEVIATLDAERAAGAADSRRLDLLEQRRAHLDRQVFILATDLDELHAVFGAPDAPAA